MKLPRFARLLPAVVLATAALLVLNGTGLVRDGVALAQTAASSLTDAPEPSNQDFAEPDQQIASAAEADIMTSLSRRRTELDAREAQVRMQADLMAATEKRVDAKIAQLQALQNKIAALVAERDDAQKAQIASLVKTYSVMKPANAARIFDTLPDTVLVPVAQLMKSDVLSLVMAQMSPENAKTLTVKLADRLALPQTADAPAPAAAPTPATPAAATPGQTASTAPAAPQKQP
jgi:flagellar motility protein MotE (MotC chaperone)